MILPSKVRVIFEYRITINYYSALYEVSIVEDYMIIDYIVNPI